MVKRAVLDGPLGARVCGCGCGCCCWGMKGRAVFSTAAAAVWVAAACVGAVPAVPFSTQQLLLKPFVAAPSAGQRWTSVARSTRDRALRPPLQWQNSSSFLGCVALVGFITCVARLVCC